jgi:PAS domain S-box-containing protein
MSFIVDITERKRTELALQESEEKYRSLFKYANDSIFIVDPATRRFLDVNENAARRLGYTREELLQLMVDDIAAPTTVDYIEPTLHKLFETGNIIFEHVHQRKDGSPMPVEISSRIIQYGDRQVIQSVVRDLTERKRIEAARQRELRSLEQLSGPPQAGGTGETFDLIPLRQTQPDTFAALVERYGDLMDFALEERGYKIKHNISEGLRAIVEHLGSLRAGPRDVVEIHITALREKSKGVSALKTEAYTEEGRLMVLELMGYLVAYFRNHSLGIEPMSASDSHNESGGAL